MIHSPTPLTEHCQLLLVDVNRRVSAAEKTLLEAELEESRAADARLAAADDLQVILAARKMICDATERLIRSRHVRALCGPPVHRVPDDLLTEIFTWAPVWYRSTSASDTDISHPAFAIASVCRRWRTVALRTSELWAKVRIVFDQDDDTAILPRLVTVLDRCRMNTMDTVLISAPAHGWVLDPSVTSVLARLFARSRRISLSWGDIVVHPSNSLLPLLMSSMPHLEEFIIAQHERDPTIYSARDHISTVKIFTLTPNIRVLDLDLLPLDLVSLQFIHNIEVFRTRCSLSSRQVHEICRTWRKLKELVVRGLRWSGDDSGPEAVFSHLRKLVCLHDGDPVLAALKRPQLPILDDLYLGVRAIGTAKTLVDFIGPSQWCQLRTLTLTGPNAQFVTQSFPDLPGVVELRLVRLENEDIAGFFNSWQSPTLIGHPGRLCCLQLIACGFGDGALQSILTFIVHRKEGSFHIGAPISRLAILAEPENVARSAPFPQWMLPRLSQLVDQVSFVETTRKIASSDIQW